MLKVVEMAFDPIIHTTIYKCILAEIKYFMVFCAKIGYYLLQLILEPLILSNFFKYNLKISVFCILLYCQDWVLHTPELRHYPLDLGPVSTIT